MSNAGKFLFGLFTASVLVLFAITFMVYGIEIALRVGAIGLCFLGFLVCIKLTGDKDGLAWISGFGFAIVLFFATFGGGNYGSRLVSNEMENARYITINGENFAIRGNEFGTFPNNSFVAQGTISATHLTLNGQVLEVTGFIESWPIIATGNGQKLTISFSK